MISGGLHAGGNLDFQDFLDHARRAPAAWRPRWSGRCGSIADWANCSSEAGYEGRLVGDEGGYGPRLLSNEAAAEFVVRAIRSGRPAAGPRRRAGDRRGRTHFFDRRAYRLSATKDARLTSDELIDRLAALVERFPVASLEDPLAEEDWSGWQTITARLGRRVRLIGDDLFATNPQRLQLGIELRRRQRGAREAQPDRHLERNARDRGASPAARATATSFPPAAAKPKTPRSPTWPWPPPPTRSRSARSPAANGWRNTTSCCGSRKN